MASGFAAALHGDAIHLGNNESEEAHRLAVLREHAAIVGAAVRSPASGGQAQLRRDAARALLDFGLDERTAGAVVQFVWYALASFDAAERKG